MRLDFRPLFVEQYKSWSDDNDKKIQRVKNGKSVWCTNNDAHNTCGLTSLYKHSSGGDLTPAVVTPRACPVRSQPSSKYRNVAPPKRKLSRVYLPGET